MAHLWEAKHDYYCTDTNYFSSEKVAEFRNWDQFMSEFADADMDYNLVFRWDWRGSNEPDEDLRHDELHIYFMGQRKGKFFTTIINVDKEDEPQVIEWLRPRLEHLVKLWQPFDVLIVEDVK